MTSTSLQYLTFVLKFKEIRCKVICLGDIPVHLTFSPARHEIAKLWLKKNLGSDCRIDNCFGHSFADLLLEFFEGRRQKFPPQIESPFVQKGTGFQRRVWERIAEIPYGETTTYGKLAADLGKQGAARAVGQACNANPLALIVPCHRVISSSGLGEFAGGSEVKSYLLHLEQMSMTRGSKADMSREAKASS